MRRFIIYGRGHRAAFARPWRPYPAAAQAGAAGRPAGGLHLLRGGFNIFDGADDLAGGCAPGVNAQSIGFNMADV